MIVSNVLRSVILLLLASAASAAETYSVTPKQVGSFNVIEGQPVVIPHGQQGPAGNAVDVSRQRVTTLTHYGTGKAFGYRLDGRDKTVTLGRGEGTGANWIVTRTGGQGDSEVVTIQAAEGRLKGWYLDCAEKEEKLPAGKQAYRVRRLILVEKPQRITSYSRYVVAP